MSKIMRVIGNSVKIFGLAAIMFALVGAALAAPSASAASLSFTSASTLSTVSDPLPTDPLPTDPVPAPILGKLSVIATDASKTGGVVNATVVVYDANAKVVTKALTDANGYFATYLAPGIYKVKIFANNYKEFGKVVSIVADQATTVKAALQRTNAFSGLPVNH